MKLRLLTELPKPKSDNSLYFQNPDDLMDWIRKAAGNGTDIRLVYTVYVPDSEIMLSHYTYNRGEKLVEGWVLYNKSIKDPRI